MTVPATTRKAGPYTGNSSATSFAFSFKTDAATDIKVSLITASVETVLSPSAYTVTLNGDQDASPGGSVTYPTSGSPITSAAQLLIASNLPISQLTDLPEGGRFNAASVEGAIDRTVMMVGQLDEKLGRALTISAFATSASPALPIPSANKLLGWNGAGTGIINYPASGASSNASEIVYLLAAAGAVVRDVAGKFREEVNVDDFGADNTGATDSTAAIQAAVNYAIANRVAVPGMVNGYSIPEIHFTGGGKYLTSGNISMGTAVKLFASKAIITSGSFPYPTVNPLFTNVAADCTIDGLVTFGFTDIIQIVTGNVDAALIEIKNIECHEWSGIAITSDNNSASTLLTIHNSKFYPRSASALILKNQCDVCLFDDNWVEGPCDTFFWNFKQLYIRGMLGVPTASTASSRWVLNEGTALTCVHSRFGGEAGARTIVDQNTGNGGTNATKLVVNNCEVFSTGFPVVRFNDIPDVFIFDENYGLNGAYPFQFNAIPAASKNNLGARNIWVVGKNEQVVLGGLRSNAEDTVAAIKSTMVQNVNANLGTTTVAASALVRNILYTEAGYTPVGSIGAGMTTGASTDIFGAAVQTVNGANGASQFNTSWSTIMAGLPAGTYTLVVNFSITQGNPVLFTMNGGNNIRTENLNVGSYTLTVPFYFDGTNSSTCGYAVSNISAGTVFAHGGLRVFSGLVDSWKQWNTEVYSGAAPVAGYWRLGDRVIRNPPAAGQPKAWVCTVAGTPGTWVSEGNL